MNTKQLSGSRFMRKMKTGIAVCALIVATTFTASAQDNGNNNQPIRRTHNNDGYGHTLNIGLGVAYYSYLGASVPFVGFNYEINVARNFTLAPSIGIASYRSYDHYGFGGSYYYYHETLIPIGLKSTYYFDELLGASPNWDFYLAASLGFNIDKVRWDDGYYGSRKIQGASTVYVDAHIGAEYHINRSLGIFLDVSTGISTIGLAVHHL